MVLCSLLSSCSSFRDSTFDDHGQNENTQEDLTEQNGTSKRFKGIFVLFVCKHFTQLIIYDMDIILIV